MSEEKESPPPAQEMSPPTRRESIAIGFAIAMQFLGFFLGYQLSGSHDSMGFALFVATPFVAGISYSLISRNHRRQGAGCVFITVAPLLVFLFAGLEGLVCSLMATPIVGTCVMIGQALGKLFIRWFSPKTPPSQRSTLLLLLLCPFFIAAADVVERPYRSIQQVETITSEIMINAAPAEVWNKLERMEKLDGPRPFLLRIGLPVPNRCELDHDGPGGQRICYFDEGHIAQEITEWEEPSRMRVHITEVTLPGRHWLTFLDASYELHLQGEQTRLVRHTTIGTKLYPRWYWRPLEHWGVKSEHAFVFSNVKRWAEEE